MDIIKRKYTATKYESNIFKSIFGGCKMGFFDIETTGLSPTRSKVMLLGIAEYTDDGLMTTQYFSETAGYERDLLNALREEMQRFDMIVTFNGRAFDLPFVNKRCAANKIPPVMFPYNLDLLPVVRNHSPLKAMLPNLKQKTIENYLGLWDGRKDQITGKESIELYYQYLTTKDQRLKEFILLHNSDDIRMLSSLLRILDKCDLHSAVFSMGFPVVNEKKDSQLIVSNLKVSSRELFICGTQRQNPFSFVGFDYWNTGGSVIFDDSRRNFEVSVPVCPYKDLLLIDMDSMGLSGKSENFSNAVSEGFLIIKKENLIEKRAVNLFSKGLLQNLFI